MIHYALRCGNAHEFDGWFRSSASFEAQAEANLLDCPVCASTAITRAVMAPRIAVRPQTSTTAAAVAPSTAPSAPASAEIRTGAETSIAEKAAGAMPAHMRAALQRIRTEVERHCEYVGPRFATEVRRLAETEASSPRPIYGEATPEEAAALAEDGIEVTRIPWVPRADS